MVDYAVSRNNVNTVKDSRQHIRKGKGLYDLDARVLHTATASAAAISPCVEADGFDLRLHGTGAAYLRTAINGNIRAEYNAGETGPIEMGPGDALLLALGDLGRDYAESFDTGDDAGPLTHDKFAALLADDDDAIADDFASAVADHGGGPVNLILLRVR